MSRLNVNDLLSEFRRRNWTLHLFGPRGAPDVYATTFQWQTCADVFVLRGEHHAFAYRVLTVPGTDVFRPQTVTWDYFSEEPAWTLRAVLTIPPPGAPGAPMQIRTPHPECGVPIELRRPVTIRPAGLVRRSTSQTTWFGENEMRRSR